MSTLVLDVNQEQEKVLEGLLRYMNISFQKVTSTEDFWDTLSPATKKSIEQGLADVDAGRYSSAKSVIDKLMSE
ncbi:hypothetical protein [Emticicia soli]|uniref:Toxin-antitoxin system, antitoxin component, ribbon-helix-helix domain protein n=1 Tax=Emticicia soli TaxID=2027878 RepID=A0ABW5J6S2_9BACT